MSPVKETSWIAYKMGLLPGKHHHVCLYHHSENEIPREIYILVLLAHGHRNTKSVREFTKECNNYGYRSLSIWLALKCVSVLVFPVQFSWWGKIHLEWKHSYPRYGGSQTVLKAKEATVLCIHIAFIFLFLSVSTVGTSCFTLQLPFLSTTVGCILLWSMTLNQYFPFKFIFSDVLSQQCQK